MKRLVLSSLLLLLFSNFSKAQTALTEAEDFTVKTLDGDLIELFALLDEDKIVVLDFFSTTCGQCQTYAYDFQLAYEDFGFNSGNTFFMAVEIFGDNEAVRVFDSIYNINLPSASGMEGGGNKAYNVMEITGYPSVVIIKPDRSIPLPFIWPPTVENITEAVLNHGGLFVGTEELKQQNPITLYPNPASKQVSIQLGGKAKIEGIRLKSISGQEMAYFSSYDFGIFKNRNEVQIPVHSLTNGIYIVEVSTGSSVYSKKLFISN